MEKGRFWGKPDFEYQSKPNERINPALFSLIVRTQIDEVIRKYEHDRFVDLMNI